MTLRFDGKVVIVTGAGGGLGRTYALEFAKRGAKVVVNDLGGDAHGTSASTSMADKVVKEIREAGGTAVANYDSVEFGAKIVKTAIDHYGRVDIVINNAGILRDISFLKMSDLDWDLIHKVHLKGAYSVTKAAWPYMRDQKYGRVIVTSSNAGIYGSFGQANYSAAKMGLVGFSNALALEGAKYNIKANALVPTAGSRLTQTVMPQDLVDALKPEYVTPLVVYLSHEACQETGKVFEAGAGWYGTIQYYRSKGKVIPHATAEDIKNNWSEITNMSQAKHYENNRDVTTELMEALGKQSEEAPKHTEAKSSGSSSSLKSAAVFKQISDGIKQNPDAAKSAKAIIQYVLTQNGKEAGKFTLDLKNEPFSVYEGEVKKGEKATAVVTVDDEDFVKVASGQLAPQKAFMSGKLKVKGNIMVLQKLGLMEKQKSKI
jgi:NAD(P)-dependent dehydrogenase (short-subunit alcohol dehydrogenase family)